MTYYELVSYLYQIEEKTIDYKNIEFLNNANITLNGERYERFINQMSAIVSNRIINLINKFREKIITEYLDVDTLSIEVGMIKNEIKYCSDLCRCLLVKPENQEEFIESIIQTNNEIANTLINFFEDEERRAIVNSLLIKEGIV